MKAILEFNLPEERNEFELAANAAALYVSLEEIKRQLRQHEKHGAPSLTLEGFYEIIKGNRLDQLEL